MFSAVCDRCGTEILLSSSRIRLLRNTDDGIVVVFRCWSGHLGSWTTGRGGPGVGLPAAPDPDAALAGSRRQLVTV
jgi:hypothetical protein